MQWIVGSPPREMARAVVALGRAQRADERGAARGLNLPFLASAWVGGTRLLREGHFVLVCGTLGEQPVAVVLEHRSGGFGLVHGPRTAAALERGELPASSSQGRLIELAPPGVVRVRATFAGGSRTGAAVVDGLWTMRPPRGERFPTRVEWLAADGAVVKAIAPEREEAARKPPPL